MDITPIGKCHAHIIREKIPSEELYLQLSEEAAELSQAASKMVRKLTGHNPTPKSEEEIFKSIVEEYTDVVLVASEILGIEEDSLVANYKLYRWNKRLEEADEQRIG